MFARGIIVLLCVLVAISDGLMPACQNLPDPCPSTFAPVCGSNGITYDNECLLCAAIKALNQNIFIRNRGICYLDLIV